MEAEATKTSQRIPVYTLIGCPVSSLSFDEQIHLLVGWAQHRLSKVVCVANVHMLIEAYRDSSFADVLKQADLVTPDGMPLVWMLRLMGSERSQRVAGMDLFLATCQQAAAKGISVFFLGSEPSVLDKIRTRLAEEFPTLKVAGMESPPFRPLSSAEDLAIVETINASGAGIVFVSLGCPKQERWMAQHHEQVQAVMLGIGAVFPLYARLVTRAPKLVRNSGLEWLYRLSQEPTRLWKRYMSTIPLFLWLAIKQLLTSNLTMETPESR
jgi:N-acetylglucosaminyldiphosphoundecaprenol N-acetyl-beta-D-mannosaminyltransferase